MKLTIQKFNIDNLCQNPRFLLLGKQDFEKAIIITNIIDYLTRIDIYDIFVFSPTKKKLDFYKSKYPMAMTYSDTIVIDKILVSSNKRIVILDDYQYKSKNEAMHGILFNSRFFNITCFWMTSIHFGIPPAMRENMDYTIIFEEPSIPIKKILFDRFISSSFLKKIFMTHANNSSATVINHEKKLFSIEISNSKHDIMSKLFTLKKIFQFHFRNDYPTELVVLIFIEYLYQSDRLEISLHLD